MVVLGYLINTLFTLSSTLEYLLKPAIVGTLICQVISFKKSVRPIKQLLLSGLIFSLIGDILLMFASQAFNFFIAGLIAFLVAQIFYCLLFGKQIQLKKIEPKFFIISLTLLIIYFAIILSILAADLENLLVPVILYMMAILTMALLALNRRHQVTITSYQWVMIGAMLFVISDSVLAINKFHTPIPMSGFCIMLSYSLAQFFITEGVLLDYK